MDSFPYKNIVDFEKLCRICLNNNNDGLKIDKENIKIENNSAPVLYLLNLLCEIKLKENYPDEICSSCLTQLKDLYKFKLQIEKSEKVLKKHLGYREPRDVVEDQDLYLFQQPSVWRKSIIKHKNPFLRATFEDPDIDDFEKEKTRKVCSIQPTNSVIDLSKRNELLTSNFAELKLERENKIGFEETNVVGCPKDNILPGEESLSSCLLLGNGTNLPPLRDYIEQLNEKILQTDIKQPQTDDLQFSKHSEEITERNVISQTQNHNLSFNQEDIGKTSVKKLEYCTISQKQNQNVKIIQDKFYKYPNEVLEKSTISQTQSDLKLPKGQFKSSGITQDNYLELAHEPADESRNKTVEVAKVVPSSNNVVKDGTGTSLTREGHVETQNESSLGNQSDNTQNVKNERYCSTCNKFFKSKYTLNVHLKRHRLEGQFVCTLCGKRFSSQGCLNRHIKIHTGEKNFECPVCQKRFLSSHNLIVHERIHTGEKPYLCSHCGKAFGNRTGLNFHVRIHTNTKPYVCNICDKAFGAQSHLVWHTMIHTGEKPFVCKECNKAFIKKCDLQRHSSVHTGVKPFQCSICEKRFSTKLNLQYHEMIHTDDRPHICPICDKKFIRRYYLQDHITKHHPVSEKVEESNK